MGTTSVASTCPGCGHEGGQAFWEARDVPVHCNVLLASADEAAAAPRHDIRLVFCPACCLVYNDRFDPDRMTYVDGYETSLHNSGVFQEYATQLAQRLVDRHDLHDKDVVELGCGGGEFLTLLAELGPNRGLGLDPSYAGEKTLADGAVRILPVPVEEAPSGETADLVCCRHVLEHIQKPADLLDKVHRWVGADTVVCFEVPNALWTLRQGGIWDIIYEHCSYFVPASLTEAFRRAGFVPLAVEEGYGGQFLVIEARRAANGDDVPVGQAAASATAGMNDLVAGFGTAFDEKCDAWRARLTAVAAAGQRAVLWGAGSKGVTFLNLLTESRGVVDRAVDLNPRKVGRFIPGTAQPVVRPEALASDPPDLVIVVNPLYRDEIAADLAAMGLTPDIEVA